METTTEEIYQVYPIGYVHSSENGHYLEILEPFRPALKRLDLFSHVIVLWWANQCGDEEEIRSIMQAELPYADGKVAGIFACRSPGRPNPIAITVCKMVGVDEENGIVPVEYIDAFDGTPVLDLKGYFPVSERVREAQVPEWASDWPEWFEEAEKLAEVFAKLDFADTAAVME